MKNREKLEKILALVDSSEQEEALTALRVARRLLAGEGLSLLDIVPEQPVDNAVAEEVAARTETIKPARSPFPQGPSESLASRVRFLEAALERRTQELKLVREQAAATERALRQKIQEMTSKAMEEADGFQRSIKILNERLSGAIHTNAMLNRRQDPQEMAVEYLNDPVRSRLSDGEIARRVGLSPHRVAILRTRLKEQMPKETGS